MSNHFHLILKQIQDGGVVKFMRKLGTGYTMYFNQKNKRSGSLFQGRYKAKHIDKDRYLKQLVHYVHANPLDKQSTRTADMLDKYPWSSWHLYTSKKDMSDIIIKPQLIKEIMGDAKQYVSDFKSWSISKDISRINGLLLD